VIGLAGPGFRPPAFWIGCGLVTAGVALHVPMFLMAEQMGWRMKGMGVDAGMYAGMALILLGTALTAFGLLPHGAHLNHHEPETFAPPEDAPLTRAHWMVVGVLSVALVIDIMKPASLGFVTPGMRAEYGLSGTRVAWLPLAALTGTVVGSFLWGALADLYGRRASIILSSVMFIGTAICGSMPHFGWNVAMCFLMGAAAGGMLPVAYALLAEIMPTRHRGWSLVLVGGAGSIGGFLLASASSAWLQPMFGWRVMWLLNLPTGLILVALSPFLPESARFLQQMGRSNEARKVLARFGAIARTRADVREALAHESHSHLPPVDGRYRGITAALTVTALSWGFVNFGVLLWAPAALVAEGRSVAAASRLIAQSTLIAAPVVALCVILYSRWSTKGCLCVMLAVSVLGLAALVLRATGVSWITSPIGPLAAVIVGASGVISVILPYTAENYPLEIRGRATGWVAGSSKLGGLAAQMLGTAGLVPALPVAAGATAAATLLALSLVGWLGRETRGRDLRTLDRRSR
jgi:MFS transporter, putative metabolite:H+ symporter